MAGQLNATAESLCLAGRRREYPEAEDRELRLRLAVRKYGRGLVLRVLGGDSEVKGC